MRWLALSVLAGSVASAQGGTTLRGTVTSADATPIEGAAITVSGVRAQARSDSLGRFRIAGVEPGVHTLTVRKIGFAALTTRVTIAAGDSAARRFNLGAPQVLDSVTVSAGRSGIEEFEARRRSRVGYFITRDQLERSAHRRLGDLMHGVPSVRVMENPNDRSEQWAMQSRGRASIQANASACFTQVYMDGSWAYTGPPQLPFNLQTISTADLEGIEYYAGGSSIPAKFNRTGSSCGVLVIWTRR